MATDARARILEAACDLIAADGIDDVRIARVATSGPRLDRARPPLLLDPRGAARAGADPLLRDGRRRALRRGAPTPTRPDRRGLARAIARRCRSRPAGARLGALGRALAARGPRPDLRPVAADLYGRYRDWIAAFIARRGRERRVRPRARRRASSPTWPWRCSTGGRPGAGRDPAMDSSAPRALVASCSPTSSASSPSCSDGGAARADLLNRPSALRRAAVS